MPFDKKENYRQLKSSDEVSAKEDKKAKENDALIKLLEKYNCNDDNFIKINSYLTKNLNIARVNKNKELIKYFEKQENHIQTFRKILLELSKNHYKLNKHNVKVRKNDTNTALLAFFDDTNTTLIEEIKICAKEYKQNKEKIKSKISFTDDGPYLTEQGLVFPETNESAC